MKTLLWKRQPAAQPEWFATDWYATHYPDVSLTGLSPWDHYQRYGVGLGRDPAPDFPAVFYRDIFRLPAHHEPKQAFDRLQAKGKARPDKRILLAAAERVMREGRPALGVSLAEEYLPTDLAHSAAILRANAALLRGDRAGWLTELNGYLAHYDVSAVTLAENFEQPIFNRFAGTVAPGTVEGPPVSVIVAGWNAEATISMAVRSLMRQTYRNLEILVVDDCSTDATWARIQELAAQDSRIRAFRNTVNAGPYVSKNVALGQARGFFITGHDADDWAHPERIARQVRFLQDNAEPACLSSMLRMSPNGEFVRLNKIGLRVHDGAARAAFIGLMADAQLIHSALGGWDEVRVGGDSELIGRLEKILRRKLPSPQEPTMFCMDNPVGLTNHATLGYSEGSAPSPHRLAYREAFQTSHARLKNENSRYELGGDRVFPAPAPMLNAPGIIRTLLDDYATQGVHARHDIETTLAIVTNLGYRGGNTASTLEEVDYLSRVGIPMVLIHTPTRPDQWNSASPVFGTAKVPIINAGRVNRLKASVIIARNPVVVSAPVFSSLAERLAADQAFIVVNNATQRVDGLPAYEPVQMIEAAGRIQTPNLRFAPAGAMMRAELEAIAYRGQPLRLTTEDWLPTLRTNVYRRLPKPVMQTPYVIGRHGRDGAEKWPERRKDLRAAYPDTPEFRISILGGADRARAVLRRLPANWDILPFGACTAADYLEGLDAFVYFSHSNLVEGFGRSIAEAMLAGVPTILPARFEPVFGDLSLYTTPLQVAPLVRLLARDDAGRVRFVTEVQDIITRRHDPARIGERLRETALKPLLPDIPQGAAMLSEASRQWRRDLMAALAPTKR